MKKAIAIILSIMLVLAITLPAAAITSVAVKSISLNTSKIILKVGGAYQLKITFTPANTSQKLLKYITDNKLIATVDEKGKVVGVKEGITSITVISSVNSSILAKCSITVSKTAVAADPYSKMPQMTTVTTAAGIPLDGKWPKGDSIEKNDILTWFKTNMNIDVKFDWLQSDQMNAFDNKVQLDIASNDMPDFLNLSTEPYGMGVLKKLVDANMIEDLTQLYQDYMSPTFKSMTAAAGNVTLNMVTFKGKLMAIPSLSDLESSTPVMWYRQDWLDKAGLKAPKNIDDVINIVNTLNAKGITSGATLPLQGNDLALCDTASLDWMFGANNAYPRQWIKGKDGSIVFGSIQPEVKKALAKAQEMYKSKLFASDFAVYSKDKAVEAVMQNKVGIFQGAWWSAWWPLANSMKASDMKAVWKSAIIANADGSYHSWTYSPVKGFIVIKKGIAHPEAILKLINISEDCNLKKNDWYNKLVTDVGAKYNTGCAPLPMGMPSVKFANEISTKYTESMNIVNGITDREKASPEAVVIADKITKSLTTPFADEWAWADVFQWTGGASIFKSVKLIQNTPAFVGSTTLMQKKRVVLEDLEKQTFLKIIMGKASIDDFDKFVTQWKQLGGDAITKEINNLF